MKNPGSIKMFLSVVILPAVDEMVLLGVGPAKGPSAEFIRAFVKERQTPRQAPQR